jgi:hypothetical protein
MTTDQIDHHKGDRKRKPVPPASDLAARIRDEGVTVAEIASELGVSKSKIARDLNDAGFRSNGEPTFQRRGVPNTQSVRFPHIPFDYIADDSRLDGAACAGDPQPDRWFPANMRERVAYEPVVKAICATCPVAAACLVAALEEETVDGLRYGIRAGLNEDERAALVESGAA